MKSKKNEEEIVRLTNVYIEGQIKAMKFHSGISEEFSGILNAEQLAKLLIGEEVFRREQFRNINRSKKVDRKKNLPNP